MATAVSAAVAAAAAPFWARCALPGIRVAVVEVRSAAVAVAAAAATTAVATAPAMMTMMMTTAGRQPTKAARLQLLRLAVQVTSTAMAPSFWFLHTTSECCVLCCVFDGEGGRGVI